MARAVLRLLCLDVRFIGGSGLEIPELVRSIDGLANLPVIILTGVSHLTESQEETIRRNRAYVFYKPEGVDEMAATLDRLLARRLPSLNYRGC